MYKYRIRNILATLPPAKRREKRAELMKKMDVKRARYYALLGAQYDDSTQMTAEQLMAAAEVLGVRAEDIANTGAANIQTLKAVGV